MRDNLKKLSTHQSLDYCPRQWGIANGYSPGVIERDVPLFIEQIMASTRAANYGSTTIEWRTFAAVQATWMNLCSSCNENR